MTEILYGLRGAQRERVAALREDERFFWLDVSLSETSLDDLVKALDISERASQALASYAETDGPSREFTLTVTASCSPRAVTSSSPEGSSGPQRMRSLDVQVVVSGEYLLTVHEERVPLTDVLAPDIAEGRSEQYVVYAVLDAMVGTGFDALNEAEIGLEELICRDRHARSA